MQAKNLPWVKIFSARFSEAIKGRKKMDISREIGLVPGNLSMYCNGYRIPTIENFRALCVLLGVKSDWLLGLDDSPPAPTIHATSGAAVASQSPGARVSAALPAAELPIDTMAIIRAQQEIIEHQKAQIATLERQLKKHGNKP